MIKASRIFSDESLKKIEIDYAENYARTHLQKSKKYNQRIVCAENWLKANETVNEVSWKNLDRLVLEWSLHTDIKMINKSLLWWEMRLYSSKYDEHSIAIMITLSNLFEFDTEFSTEKSKWKRE